MEPDAAQTELGQLRDENALLAQLLRIERVALANFMAYAARTLARARSQLQRRTHEPAQFQDKLNRLHKLYTRLHRRAVALPLPCLARLLENAIAALDAPRSDESRTGDALLPALICLDAVFLALMSVAQHTGVPLSVRRGARRRPKLSKVNTSTERHAHAGNQSSQLTLALQQLGEQLSGAQGKLIQLTTIGLEQVPDSHFAAFYDMLSQMLRNAIEHGIETPAQRRAGGKNPRGTLLAEFQHRPGGHSELNFQDDGAGLDAERIVQAAVASGFITEDTSLEQNRRQASALIFQAGLSTVAEPGGRGLGMRILRDNVKRLHGQIQVATKRGLFTRVRIRVPLPATEELPLTAAQA